MNRLTSIMWFTQDLRLEDNAALEAAIARGGAVVPVYVWSPEQEWDWRPGAAARWWLRHSLIELSARLESVGSRLIVREGDASEVLPDIVNETGATAVFFNRRFEPAAVERERRAMTALANRGVDVHPFNDSLLFDPDHIRNRSGKPFLVFTPFWKHLLTMENPSRRIPAPPWMTSPPMWPPSQRITDRRILPGEDQLTSLHSYWTPGELAGQEEMSRFTVRGHDNYDDLRDRPGSRGTSRLSPYLHFGEVGPRRLWYEVTRSAGEDGTDSFLRQLAWREFSHHLLYHFPHSPTAPLRSAFEAFPWSKDDQRLRLWRSGRTGYPLVDAGMRELMATGWMHNRVRMVAASFLVKHLMVHWLEGARWFWERLVDADLANNTMGWQWVAGCGADAAPYFRVFNPAAQGRRHDPNGAYVRRWVPELALLPDDHIHEPWTAPPATLKTARVELGRTYPTPIVNHQAARSRALEAYETIKGAGLQLAGRPEEVS